MLCSWHHCGRTDRQVCFSGSGFRPGSRWLCTHPNPSTGGRNRGTRANRAPSPNRSVNRVVNPARRKCDPPHRARLPDYPQPQLYPEPRDDRHRGPRKLLVLPGIRPRDPVRVQGRLQSPGTRRRLLGDAVLRLPLRVLPSRPEPSHPADEGPAPGLPPLRCRRHHGPPRRPDLSPGTTQRTPIIPAAAARACRPLRC